MTTSDEDPLHLAAWQVADSLADSGYAFVENDQIDSLTATLQTFLHEAGIAINASPTPPRSSCASPTAAAPRRG